MTKDGTILQYMLRGNYPTPLLLHIVCTTLYVAGVSLARI